MNTLTMSQESALIAFLQPYQQKIDHSLEEAIKEMGPETHLRKACAYILRSSGKRLRPALVLMMQESVNKEENALPSALAIEFFHTASLIADDLPCMDDDDLRRNQPSMHKAYGESTALLASYALIATGYGLIAKNQRIMKHPKGNTLTLALENAAFNTGLFGATGGQFFDLSPPDKTENTLCRIIHMKTTSLFEIAFVFGWLFGGGDEKYLSSVKNAASHFGLLFQILDDFEDFERDKKEDSLNSLALLGIDRAKQLLHHEMSAFKEVLKNLGISRGPLQSLASILESVLSFK